MPSQALQINAKLQSKPIKKELSQLQISQQQNPSSQPIEQVDQSGAFATQKQSALADMHIPSTQSDKVSKQTSSTVIQDANKVVGKEDPQISVDFAPSEASVSSKAVSKKR
jgi:hypothetical protein|tara:strand:+ start:3286 stop:3618 length:333 start_codon:yes stop_codon:yes gene_type:complete